MWSSHHRQSPASHFRTRDRPTTVINSRLKYGYPLTLLCSPPHTMHAWNLWRATRHRRHSLCMLVGWKICLFLEWISPSLFVVQRGRFAHFVVADSWESNSPLLCWISSLLYLTSSVLEHAHQSGPAIIAFLSGDFSRYKCRRRPLPSSQSLGVDKSNKSETSETY